MFRRKPVKALVVAGVADIDDTDATILEAGGETEAPSLVQPTQPEPATSAPRRSTSRKLLGRLSRYESKTATQATPDGPNTPRRSHAWSRSTGSLLRLASDNVSINVLRMSLFELHDRMSYRWVLHPQSPLKTFWDLLSALIVVYYSWIIPFMLCFEWYEPSSATIIFMKVLDAWGFLDIALRFRTGFIEYGAVVMNPHKIRQAYVRSIWFPIDIASTIPFEYFINDTSTSVSTRKTIKMIKYIKLPRLLRLGRFVKYLKKYKRYSSVIISLNAVIFSAHVAGCLWVAILKPCADVVEATRPHCQDGGEMGVYWVAFHHGMVSLLGVSATHVESSDRFLSGGYHHSSNDDLSTSVYLWSIAVSVYGAVISAILFGTIIGLQLNLLHDPGMSLALRRQIAIYLFKDNLQKIPFFQLATDAVLGMICMQLHQVIYMPDDFIIREGEIGKELFMIVKGIVRVLPPNSCKIPQAEAIILLSEGDFFGEIGVVMEVERTRSVKAECMAELCVLAREGFDKILVEFPEFATAMKKLIVKRVGEMWKDDGPERMEKMTALADAKMKKTIQAYKNMEKLRNKTRALANFRPRLSNLLSASDALTPHNLREYQGSARATAEIVAAAAAATAAAAASCDTALTPVSNPDKPPLGAITEDSAVEESKTPPESRYSSILDRAQRESVGIDFARQTNPAKDAIAVLGVEDRKPQHIVVPPVVSTSSMLQLEKMETQLRLVEQNMETKMASLDSKLEQILRYLAPAKPHILPPIASPPISFQREASFQQ
ncbi:unnamed protein product [Phytophthora fragariaefolia]|uniref:Unnamed protein product n=1 Tax=Phytophthora fragariaefolia TaxID=1490495 RepID=A0A9W6U4F3_9STRA|nr:unnamed protein product [Phytophthora fragariaefolia]